MHGQIMAYRSTDAMEVIYSEMVLTWGTRQPKRMSVYLDPD